MHCLPKSKLLLPRIVQPMPAHQSVTKRAPDQYDSLQWATFFPDSPPQKNRRLI